MSLHRKTGNLRSSPYRAVAAVAAACVVLAVPSPSWAQLSACAAAVQGRIAWDGRNNTYWTGRNLEALCEDAENSTEPGACFAHVMTSDAVNHGGGTHWNPGNALRLCAGATNTRERIACFDGKVAQRIAWGQAVDQCKQATAGQASPPRVRTEREAIRQTESRTTGVTTPSAARSETPEEARSSLKKITCRGPLKFQFTRSSTQGRPNAYDFEAEFVGVGGPANLQPGECWRDGGWDFGPALAGAGRKGRLLYRGDFGSCPFVESMTVENGRITDYRISDRLMASNMMDSAIRGNVSAFDTRWIGSADAGTSRQAVPYVIVVPTGVSTNRPGCQ